MVDPPAPTAVALRDVGKRYRKLDERPTLLGSLLPTGRRTRTDLWALRHVDLAVAPGETIGILGRNGAGKSTLLRLLAGVSRPSEGEVEIRGRVAPLLSVGVGFHPELTGRENVFVNGMLLGLDRDEVTARLDAIVAFAELHDFLDTPVKFYSSGMFMRLGFSVAVHAEPEILLVDEVLAVGDVSFQLRCLERMRSLQDTGTTIVLVSHAMHAVRLLCPRAAVLAGGRLVYDGPVEDAIGTHHTLLSAPSDQRGVPLNERRDRGAVGVEAMRLLDQGGSETASVGHREPLVLTASLHFHEDVEAAQVMFVVRGEDGAVAYQAISAFGAGGRSHAAGATAELRVPFQAGFGGGGTFAMTLTVVDRDGADVLGRSEEALLFHVAPTPGTFGPGDLGARILLDGEPIDEHADLALRASEDRP